jgi:hypothetical protein
MIMVLCDNCEVNPCILRPTEKERKNAKELDCPYYKNGKPTNADRIRAMSDQELAEWIARTQIGAIKDAMNLLRLPYDEPDGLVEIGKTEALEWLKQPAEE